MTTTLFLAEHALPALAELLGAGLLVRLVLEILLRIARRAVQS